MCSVLQMVILSLAFLVMCTDGNVVIQRPGKACICGRNLTLTCMLKEQKFAVAWMNANDITPIAQCVQRSCDLNPMYLGQYTFSSDVDRNIFNLTIIKVSMKDNGRKLVCSDGSNTGSLILKVTDYEPQLIEDTKNGVIMATSGCVSQDWNVTFKWILVDADSKMEKEIQPKTPKDTNRTGCLNDSDCSHNAQVQYTEVINVKASDNANFYVKIAAEYGNERKETPNTAVKYFIEEQVSDNKSSSGPNYATVLGIVVGFIGFTVIVFATVFYLHKRHNTSKKDKLPRDINIEKRDQSSLPLKLSDPHSDEDVLQNDDEVLTVQKIT